MTQALKSKVLVLMGGPSSEREVSLTSSQGIVQALKNAGYTVHCLDVQEPFEQVLQLMIQIQPDVIFNGLYGGAGENGSLQGFLNMLKIPYTHSGVLASAIAMDKSVTRSLLMPYGIGMPEGCVMSQESLLAQEPLPRPFVVKPVREGSSVGVTIVDQDTDLAQACARCPGGEDVLVEEFIPGQELSVGLLGPHAQGVVEIRPVRGFYDYQAKYEDEKTQHFMPAEVPSDIYELALRTAERAYALMGCRGAARADFRYDAQRPQGRQLYMLEMNTQPGLTPVSLLPEIVAYHGMSFEELMTWMVENAACDL